MTDDSDPPADPTGQRITRPDGDTAAADVGAAPCRQAREDAAANAVATPATASSAELRAHRVQLELQNEELRRAHARLTAVLESSAAAIWSVDTELRLVFGNSVFRDGIKHSLGLEIAPGQHILADGLAEELRTEWAGYYRRCLSGERFVIEAETRDFPARPFGEYSFNPMLDDEGAVIGAVVFRHDLTDRRRAEQALAQVERRFRETIENVDLVAVGLDTAGCTTFVNDHLLRLTGWRREEVLGREWFDTFVPADQRDDVRAVFRDTVATGNFPAHYDNPILTRAGEQRIVHWSNTALRDADGNVVGTFSLGEDRTDVVAAETALRASEERYRSLFSSMAEGFALHEIICDEHGTPVDYRFLDANPAFFELTRLPRSIIGHTVREVLPAAQDFWIETYGRVALGGEPTQFEHYAAPLDSRFEVRAFSPRPGQFATVFLDISERHRAEIERARLLREVRGLAARLAAAEDAERKELARELHDRVGQSLTALGLNLSALRGRLPEASRAGLGPRLDDAERLLRATAGEVRDVMAELRPPMLDEYGLVAALQWLGEQFASRSGIAVTVAGDEPTPRFGPDHEMTLFRISQEALTNVAKHAAATTVAITIEPTATGGTLTIRDDGVGFDPDAARAGAGRERTWGQLIMQERATSIGARCTVTSQHGEGTVVTIEVTRTPR